MMATFNEPADVVALSIGSILGQTMGDLELLVLDDSTSAATVAAIDAAAASDSRMRVIRTRERMGFTHALNVGLGLAQGRFVARMDGDDIALPDRLERQTAFLEANPAIDVVGGAMQIIDGEGRVTGARSYPEGGWRLRAFALFRSPLAHPTVTMRREAVDNYDERFSRAEDLDLWLRLWRRGRRLANLSEVVLQYRVEGDLASRRDRSQFVWACRARRKNFDWRRPVWSALSVCISWLYTLASRSLVSAFYRRENRRQTL